ncbi:peptidylprolyl isomerase [Caenimonas aquaedulcis]|uniref:Chaperone SurA n=1 Tax=Caenimonas aquaedulcis TaxID=2793270 RepID=A0A931MHP6_9BURK|nr:peptidylprolyl isomerase [Caenimonas aquaedulcis]MBG9388969.1 peptidylprolyl isomerase [Caenimonas aquaedulcis]
MNLRPSALGLVFAAQALVLALPAAAQGFRPLPFTAARPAARDTGPRQADYIVAVVNSEPITNNEVRDRMARFEQQLAQQGQPVPPRAEFARQVLERLISERAQLQLARENGIKAEEAAVDLAEQNVARQNRIDVPELRKRLAADGIPLAQFRADLREQLLLTRLRERELESRVRVSDLEIDEFLRNQKNSNDPASMEINLAHILIAVPENANEQQAAQLRARAQRVLERARAGEDFAKLAAEFSDAPGAATNGGIVGLRTGDRYPPLFFEAVQALPEGGVAELVRSGAGFHVIKMVEKHQGGVAGMRVVQSHARHILLRPSAQLSETAALARLADFKKRIEAGQADFAQLARESSQDASAPNGGDLGWASPGLFVPEFEDAMNSLAPGKIADPIVSRFGVHLIQLLERRQSTLTQREQREIARNMVKEKKLDEAYVQWAQEVRGRAYVEFRQPPQ